MIVVQHERDFKKAFSLLLITGLSLKRDPVDRDHAEDRVKRLGAIL